MTDVTDPREALTADYVGDMSRITPILLLIACIHAGPALAGPELKKSEVKRLIEEATPDIVSCGADLPAETIVARFTIQPEGGVGLVRIDGRHSDDDVGRCMKRRIGAVRFGHSIKSTPVSYPFHVGKGDAKAAKASRANGEWKGSGQLTKKDLDGLLDILEGDIKRCGEGTARTKFTIRKDGKVRDVRVADVDPKTEDCVSRKVSKVRFPAPAKNTHVDHAFDLDEG